MPLFGSNPQKDTWRHSFDCDGGKCILDSGIGYRDEEIYVPVLFYADDGMLLARSCAEAKSMIGVVVGVAGICGLSINKGKSSVMLYNYRGIPMESVGGSSGGE